MKRLLLLSALLAVFGISSSAKKQKQLTEKDMGAYLFTYFNDATHSLFMAISYDGYTFTAINGSEPIISGDSIAEQHGYGLITGIDHFCQALRSDQKCFVYVRVCHHRPDDLQSVRYCRAAEPNIKCRAVL